MRDSRFDVVIIGAGVAGLSALRELDRAGFEVLCLEARDRIGGRILTVRDSFSPIPIELGAEFIHGRPPEIWDLLRARGLCPYDCGEYAVHVKNGQLQGEEDAWLLADEVMEDMQRAASRGPDQSFASFVDQSSRPDSAKRLARSYVEGFNAAQADVIGIASLAEDAQAADEIDGDRTFRTSAGYDSVVHALWSGSHDLRSTLRLSSVVDAIEWRPDSATIHAYSAITRNRESFASRAVVNTIPLGVLLAEPNTPGAILHDPEPKELIAAARQLRFGQVMRVILRFREPFWEENDELADVGFLLSEEHFFPTWWTPLPFRAPIITGWSAGPHADPMLGQPQSVIFDHALSDLARITRSTPGRLSGLLEAAYFHDWHQDPFSRGAYSYVPAGALPARAALAQPVAGTLFFAGEATELNGHSATVHGAIASGKRVAQQILQQFGS